VINSKQSLISHRLAAIARNDLQDHPRSMTCILSKTVYATFY